MGGCTPTWKSYERFCCRCKARRWRGFDLILEAQRIFVVGQKRSGLLMRMFALRLMQLGLTVHVVGDATTPAIGTGDLLVVCSGGGETAGALTPARKAE